MVIAPVIVGCALMLATPLVMHPGVGVQSAESGLPVNPGTVQWCIPHWVIQGWLLNT